MKIVIAGAGEVGFHLAKLLSQESQDIIVIDSDKQKLKAIDDHLDVFIKKGDATSFKCLRSIKVSEADIFIAVTDSQSTNLTASLIAKKLEAKKVIARVSNTEYLERENLVTVKRFGVDHLISPERLAALEIEHLIEDSAFNESHTFENGELNLYGVKLSEGAPLIGKTTREITDSFSEDVQFLPIAIIRKEGENCNKTIIPKGNHVYQLHDRVYFIALRDVKLEILNIVGKTDFTIKNIMILGGGAVGKMIGESLSKTGRKVKIIEQNPQRAFDLADDLKSIMVIEGDGRKGDLLEEENISETDAFISVTGNSETNIMSCLLAGSKGIKKTIALVENIDYIGISQQIGIDAFINKKLLAANDIFRYIRKGDVVDITSISDLGAEVLEFKVEKGSKIAGKTIRSLGFPSQAIIAGIVRKSKGIIPNGDFIIEPYDKVVVLCKQEAITQVESYF